MCVNPKNLTARAWFQAREPAESTTSTELTSNKTHTIPLEDPFLEQTFYIQTADIVLPLI